MNGSLPQHLINTRMTRLSIRSLKCYSGFHGSCGQLDTHRYSTLLSASVTRTTVTLVVFMTLRCESVEKPGEGQVARGERKETPCGRLMPLAPRLATAQFAMNRHE